MNLKFLASIFIGVFSSLFCDSSSLSEPVVTAEKYIEYKKNNGHIIDFSTPEIVLVCYQQSTLKYFLNSRLEISQSESFANLYLVENGKVGILGGWGMGAPALAEKMEQLIALGVKRFVAVGIAGTLMHKHPIGSFIVAPKALAEDGVSHLYLKGKNSSQATPSMLASWNSFLQKHSLEGFHSACAWSFPAIFKETPQDIIRVTEQGYDVVEMEAATLYAIGEEKGAETLSLFVISDSMDLNTWISHTKEPAVRNNLNQLADWALIFCMESCEEYVSPGSR